MSFNPVAPSEPACACGGCGWLRSGAPYGHPDFGKLVECVCMERLRAERAAVRSGKLLPQLAQDLGRLAGSTLANFDLRRPLARVDGGEMLPPPPPAAWDRLIEPAEQLEMLLNAHGQAEQFAACPVGWLYLWGSYGSGKSHLAAAIAHAVAATGRPAAYATAPRLLAFLRAGFADNSADQRLVALQQVPLLVVDDLGTEKQSDWAAEKLFDLLNDRYLYERPTVLTSNLPPEAQPGRLADRVLGSAVVVPLLASSYRQLHRRSA